MFEYFAVLYEWLPLLLLNQLHGHLLQRMSRPTDR